MSTIHKVFKPAKRGDSLRSAYIYADGHVVCFFERYELGTKLGYVKLAQSCGVHVQFPIDPNDEKTHEHGSGRVVFHEPAALIAISLLPNPSISLYCGNESNRDREQGVKVDSLHVSSSVGGFELDQISTHSSSINIQAGECKPTYVVDEAFADVKDSSYYGTDSVPVLAVYKDEEEA